MVNLPTAFLLAGPILVPACVSLSLTTAGMSPALNEPATAPHVPPGLSLPKSGGSCSPVFPFLNPCCSKSFSQAL